MRTQPAAVRVDSLTMFRILIGSLLMVTVARGAPQNGVVLESYTGDRPPDAPRLLGPVLEELSRQGYAAGDTIGRSFETKASRAALSASALPSDFAAQVDRGHQAWVQGKFDEAINLLGALIKTAHANTGAFALTPSLRDPLLKGLIALALANQRSGDLGAMKATFSEIARSFPEAQVSGATYGPDAQVAFDQARRDLSAIRRGKLKVNVSDDNGIVFINEAYRATGSTTAELIPGEYRVVVVLNKLPSRSHVVEVKANAETVVEIDLSLDRVIRTYGFTGLVFASANEREANETRYAARVAKSIGASAVIVVGIDQVRGRGAVVGSLVSLETGRELRRASVPTEPDPSTDKLRALARFLAGEEPVPGLDVQLVDASEGPRPKRSKSNVVPLVIGAGGIALLAGGLGLELWAVSTYNDAKAEMTDQARRDSLESSANTKRYVAEGLAVAGVACVGVAMWLYLTRRGDSAATTASHHFIVSPTGIAFTGAF